MLATGRSEVLPANTANPQFDPSINQIPFKMGSLSDLRDMRERLAAEGGSKLFPANHGVAWSIYAHDPEGNNLEFFVDTEWYITQPFLIPLDLSKTDADMVEESFRKPETLRGERRIQALQRLAQEYCTQDDTIRDAHGDTLMDHVDSLRILDRQPEAPHRGTVQRRHQSRTRACAASAAGCAQCQCPVA